MHIIQQKILALAKNNKLAGLTLRKIGELIGEKNSPQKIKHHLNQLISKGLLVVSADGKEFRMTKSGIDEKSKLVSLPILGSANCGQALLLADSAVEGYLKVSVSLLGSNLVNKAKDLYVLKAVGNSMNRANINDQNIEDGDFIIIDKNITSPQNGNYVVSVIDGAANIKRFYKKDDQIILSSESSQDFPPIYIHKNDYDSYFVCGRVVSIMKKPDELALMRDASAADILGNLGPISKEEMEHYKNL